MLRGSRPGIVHRIQPISIEGRLSLDVHFVDPQDPEPEIRIARVLEHLVPPGLEPGDRIRVHYAMGVVTEITRDEVARQKSG
jgi:hypothetical protein